MTAIPLMTPTSHDLRSHVGVEGVSGVADITDVPATETDTAKRLAPDGAGGVAWAATGGGGISSGTSFPGSPATNDLFFRTDLKKLYVYDGTRWFTVNEYTLPFVMRTSFAAAITATSTVGNAPVDGSGGSVFVTELRCVMFVNTTSSGTQYWEITLEKGTPDNPSVYTTIGTCSSISNTANIWVMEAAAINEVVDPSTHPAFRIMATKVSTPGSLFAGISVKYREIAT